MTTTIKIPGNPIDGMPVKIIGKNISGGTWRVECLSDRGGYKRGSRTCVAGCELADYPGRKHPLSPVSREPK